ncbi:MAG: TetR/AcrR family transcriptional regulator [Anaerolineae bacterium]|nr:TetR/AcrR family transcriptional regulator [Anaerolineae bacterium]
MAYDNRANLVIHALRLFASRGYDAVSVQEVVEAAGVTKPTLYHYFGSKRGLLDALLAERGGRLVQAVQEAASYRGDLPLTLRKVTIAYFSFAREQSAFYRLLLSLWLAPPSSEGHQAVLPLLQQQQDLLEALFAQAAKDHGNMKGRHQAYAATLLGMINTYVGLALNEHIDLDDALLYQAVHQFQHGIYS